jgi:YHS domain-containing protein
MTLFYRKRYNIRMLDTKGHARIRTSRFVTLCGRVFHNTDPQYFPQVQYRGRTIYLCTESCLGAFEADPARFYLAHRKSAHKMKPPRA